MTGMDAIRGLVLLLLCQSLGEGLQRLLGLPWPGPVVGLMLALALLSWPAARPPVAAAAEPLLHHLSLLFVPVGVGVVTHLGVMSRHAVPIVLALLVSTWVGMAVTALVLKFWMGDSPQRGLPENAP
jgi:holin-like protein